MKLTRAQELALINYAVNHIIQTFLTDEGEEVKKTPLAKKAAAVSKSKRHNKTGTKWSPEQRRKYMEWTKKRQAERLAQHTTTN